LSSAGALKVITVSGAGNLFLGGNTTSAISNGSGQVGITMAGTGVLTMGGNNTFTGDLLIKSGTVAKNSGSAGGATSFGAGTIKLGDTAAGNTNATVQFTAGASGMTFANPITVQSGNSGIKTIENPSGNFTATLSGLLTLDDNLTVKYSGGTGGKFTLGANATANAITGSGNLTFLSNGTVAAIITGNNTGFSGNVAVQTGGVNVGSVNALNSNNTVAVASGATFDTNNQTVTIAGLNDVSGSGGTVTNAGAAKTLTLGGGGSYSFSGTITATTSANMTVTKTGSGTQTLAGTNTYTGATTVNLGTLLINGSLTSSVTANTGTVGGSGSTTGNVTVGDSAGGHDAFIAPGGIGTVGTFTTTGSMSLLSDATYNFKLNGTAVANDKLVAAGVTINSSALFSFTLLGDTSGLIAGQVFDIMHTTSGITGTFSNLAAGSTFDAGGGLTFNVFNSGGGYGNDLYLTVATVPEPATWGLLAFSLMTVLVLRRRLS
ncbi:MAG: autotransporter-associated beta strand repeat-containing protein, partial [Planctomycetota bacterium]